MVQQRIVSNSKLTLPDDDGTAVSSKSELTLPNDDGTAVSSKSELTLPDDVPVFEGLEQLHLLLHLLVLFLGFRRVGRVQLDLLHRDQLALTRQTTPYLRTSNNMGACFWYLQSRVIGHLK